MSTFHVSLQVALFALSISQGGLPEPQLGWHGFVTLCTLKMSQYLMSCRVGMLCVHIPNE